MVDTIKIGAQVNLDAKEAEAALKKLNAQGRAFNKELKASKAALNAVISAEKGPTGSGGDREAFRSARAGAGTGAAGRDFAKHAQGLGGLVHIYATFAANIFAVTAAFQALDKAFTLTRLEKAADIMSKNVGFSIRNLSKDLLKATDHSISFQEALQFSAIGTSAGLTAKQIANLTTIAKGAANALGRDMGDAVRRIIQGTAKQEQEILDELGIFVKAKTAYKEYAEARNLKVDDLSAAQRVAAYTEAVEKAGAAHKKFADIEDPFTKFTAALIDTGTTLLNFVNTVLSPIFKILSESKVLIAGLLLGVTGLLAKMAIPEIGKTFDNWGIKSRAKELAEAQANANGLIAIEERKVRELKRIENEKRKVYESYFKGPLEGAIQTPSKGRMPAAYDKSDIKANIEAKIRSSIGSGELSIQEAINQKLIRAKSTRDNILINQTTLNGLGTKAIDIQKKANIALQEYAAQQDKVLDAVALQATVEEETAASINKIRNAPKQVSTIGRDIRSILSGGEGAFSGWLSKSTEKVDQGKFVQLYKALTYGFKTAREEGNKLNFTLQVLGTTLSLAFEGIQKAFFWIMGVVTVYNIITSVLPALDIFTSKNDALAESTDRLIESTKAIEDSWKDINNTINTQTLGLKGLDAEYGKLSTSASNALDELNKQKEEFDKLKDLGGEAKYSDLKAMEAQLSAMVKSGAIDESSEAYKKLSHAVFFLHDEMIQGAEANKIFGKAFIEASAGIKLFQNEIEATRKIIQDFETSSKNIDDAMETLAKKHRESLDPNLLGGAFKTPEGQTIYKELANTSETIFGKKVNFANRREGLLSIREKLDDLTEGLKVNLPLLARFDKLSAKISSYKVGSAPTELKTQLEKLAAEASIAYDHLKYNEPKSHKKDTFNDTNPKFGQEELKLLKQQGEEQKRNLGYMTQEQLNAISMQEYEVVALDFAKEIQGKKGKELELQQKITSNKVRELFLSQQIAEEANNKAKYDIEIYEKQKQAISIKEASYKLEHANLGISSKVMDNLSDSLKFEELKNEELRANNTLSGNPQQLINELERIAIKRVLLELGIKARDIDKNNLDTNSKLNLELELYQSRQQDLINGKNELSSIDDLQIDALSVISQLRGELLNKLEQEKGDNLKVLQIKKQILDLDIRANKIREDKINVEQKIPLSRIFSGNLPDGETRGSFIGRTFKEGAAEEARKAEQSQKGAMEGMFLAFNKGLDSSMQTLFDSIQSGAELTSSAIAKAFKNAASDIFKELAIEQAKLAIKQGINALSSLFLTPSANGNIMTDHGPLQLNKYASGGIANSPQLSLFGEGRKPEAYVPLPDGRSIPVTMKGNSNAGDNISIQVNINTTTNSSETKAIGGNSKDSMASLGNLISQKVKEVIINEKRPNGLLAR